MVSAARTGRGIALGMIAALLIHGQAGAEIEDTAPRPAKETMPVLLTIDVEQPDDFEKLREIGLTVPATYFITGKMAEWYPDKVRGLAMAGNTVGSHSYKHPHLTELTEEDVYQDLAGAKFWLEAALGQQVHWFRAPYLDYDANVSAVLRSLGFRYDSSLPDRWNIEQPLPSLPISSEPKTGQLAADYNWFNEYDFDDHTALNWLQRQFDDHLATKRPLVILLHPSTIIGHHALIHQFIAYASDRGARFLSADQYLKHIAGRSTKRRAAWLDPADLPSPPDAVVKQLRLQKVTDIFLLAKGPKDRLGHTPKDATPGTGGFAASAKDLKRAGFRIHAWFPVGRDAKKIGNHPEWAMVDLAGKASDDWLSWSDPALRDVQIGEILSFVSDHPIDGLLLDYLGYPDLNHDYAAGTLAAFHKATGLEWHKPAELLEQHYIPWTDRRAASVAEFVARLRKFLVAKTAGRVALGAVLDAGATVSFEGRDQVGQDYFQLAEHLDYVVPFLTKSSGNDLIGHIKQVVLGARSQVGQRQVIVALSHDVETAIMSTNPANRLRLLQMAARGADGFAFDPIALSTPAAPGPAPVAYDAPPAETASLPAPDPMAPSADAGVEPAHAEPAQGREAMAPEVAVPSTVEPAPMDVAPAAGGTAPLDYPLRDPDEGPPNLSMGLTQPANAATIVPFATGPLHIGSGDTIGAASDLWAWWSEEPVPYFALTAGAAAILLVLITTLLKARNRFGLAMAPDCLPPDGLNPNSSLQTAAWLEKVLPPRLQSQWPRTSSGRLKTDLETLKWFSAGHQGQIEPVERLLALRRDARSRKAIDGVGAGSDAGWQGIADRIAAGQAVTGQMIEQVSAQLHALGSQRIEQFRKAYLLDLVDSGSDPIAMAEANEKAFPNWSVLAKAYIQEQLADEELAEAPREGTGGDVADTARKLTITTAGTKALQDARDSGYDRQFWAYCEQRLHEILLVSCPHCGASNHASWFWRDLQCFHCERMITSQQVHEARIEKAVISTQKYVRI